MDIDSPRSRLDASDRSVPAGGSGGPDATGAGGDPAGAGAAAGPQLERLGDYRILRELGRGGMGVVYEAERESLRVRVALKVMHPTFRADATRLRRFEREARSAARLHRTNIVPVFDYGEHDGICYCAMQMISAVGLNEVIEEVRRPGAGPESRDLESSPGFRARALVVGRSGPGLPSRSEAGPRRQ